jgi:hypothetical protein
VARLIFEDPAELGRRFCSLLERYWEEAFADEWRPVEPLLAEAVEDAGRRISAEGVFGLLRDLRPAGAGRARTPPGLDEAPARARGRGFHLVISPVVVREIL